MNAILFILAQSFIPWYLTPSPEPSKPAAPTTPDQPVKEAPAPVAAIDSVAEFKEITDVAILLPESAQGGVDGNMVDFYNGALIAARELGLKGRRMKIHTYGVSEMAVPGVVDRCDVILGPVSPADILKISKFCQKRHHFISPLEPKSASLADSLAIVQVPTPVACQISDNVCWIKEELGPTDEILVVCPDEDTSYNPNHDILIRSLHELGLTYKRIKLSESVAMFETPKPDTTFRVLIDGTDELFVTNTLREMTARCLEGNKMIVYHPSKVRTYENLKIEYMHSCNLRVSASYFVDYSDEATRKFVREYRALFEAEPNSFAFHGYDCLKYFVDAYRRYGSLWFEHLEEMPEKGLNASFLFKKQDKPGKINSGIRRLTYNSDWSITAQ